MILTPSACINLEDDAHPSSLELCKKLNQHHKNNPRISTEINNKNIIFEKRIAWVFDLKTKCKTCGFNPKLNYELCYIENGDFKFTDWRYNKPYLIYPYISETMGQLVSTYWCFHDININKQAHKMVHELIIKEFQNENIDKNSNEYKLKFAEICKSFVVLPIFYQYKTKIKSFNKTVTAV